MGEEKLVEAVADNFEDLLQGSDVGNRAVAEYLADKSQFWASSDPIESSAKTSIWARPKNHVLGQTQKEVWASVEGT